MIHLPRRALASSAAAAAASGLKANKVLLNKYSLVFERKQRAATGGRNSEASESRQLEGSVFSTPLTIPSARYESLPEANNATGEYDSSDPNAAKFEQEIAKSFTRAKFAHQFGRNEEAIEIISTFVLPQIASLPYFGEKHPIYADVLAMRGLCQKEAGKLLESLESLSIAVRIFSETTTMRHYAAARAIGHLSEVYSSILDSPNREEIFKKNSHLRETVTLEKANELKENAAAINRSLDVLGGCGCCSCASPVSHCAQLTCRWGKSFCLERTSCEVCPSPAEAAHQASSIDRINTTDLRALEKLEEARVAALNRLPDAKREALRKSKTLLRQKKWL